MDSRSTFLHRRGFKAGLEKDSGWGQWLPPMRQGTAVASPRLAAGRAMRPCFPEKARRINPPAVPKPTQVGGYKHTKARGRNLVKELGNMAP